MPSQQGTFSDIVQATPAPYTILDYTDGTYNYYGYADPGSSTTDSTSTSWRWQRVRIAAATGTITPLVQWTGPMFNQNALSPASKTYS
jgi:hypothetical protein